LVHPEDKELVVSRLRRKQADEAFDSSPMKVRVLTKSGEIRWIETNSVRIQWGRRSALHVFTFDITERELADEKLRDAEASLKNTFNISPGLICVADANAGYFTECNPAVTRILGISVEEFTSTPFMEFVHPDDRQGTVDEITKQLRGSTVANFENRYRCKDGSYKWLAWQATAADKNGKVHAVAADITEHKQAEEALKKSEKDLRTLSLRIFYAQEDERRRIGNELHDGIAQTLGAIKIWAETAEHEITINNSIKAKKSLNRIIPLTQETIEEVRRISKNLHPPILDKIGILAAIDSLIDEFKHTHEEVQVINELNIDESDVPYSLRIVIYRVMQEALNNVSKHSRASLVRLSLNKSITKLELVIIDNGLGFDSEEVSSSQLGRGLGLTSMKERVILTGGNFVCESNKGKGTTLKASWIFSETN
jgi:PAS domain S-box-containing protein